MRKLTKWMGLVLCGVMLLSQLTMPVSAAMFNDINGHWCQNKIESWASSGIINGYNDGSFRPSNDITRAEFIKLVNRVFKFTKGKAIKFTDVKSEDWYFSELQIAYNEGYIGGYEDGTVRPQRPITRQEVAKVITTLLGLTENSTTAWNFTDYDNMDSWSRGYIGAVVNAGIMSGYSSGPYAGTFGGRRNITRAEVVEALWKASEHNVDPPVTDVTVNSANYSPSTLTTVKDLYIQYADNVTISNVMVLGSVYVDARLGDRTVTMKNVTVSNNLVVDQGSWVLDGCEIKNINLAYKGAVVTLKNRTTVDTANVTRSATIDHSGLTNNYKGIKTMSISCNDTSVVTLKGGTFDDVNIPASKQNVNLSGGKIENMSITGSGTEVTLSTGTVLNYVYVGADCRVVGAGTVKSANVEARSVVMQRKPDTLLGSRTPSYLGDYTLNFLITDGASGKALRGVTIKLNDLNETGTTATNGQYKFNNIASGTINYTVTMAGYAEIKGSVRVNENKVVELVMNPQGTYTAELTIQDSMSKKLLPGAIGKYTMNSRTYNSSTSQAAGKIWFNNLGNATYTYTVSCPGYVTSAPANFTINGKDLVVSSAVNLVPTSLTVTAESADGTPIKNFSVQYPGSNGFVSTTNSSLNIRYLTSGTNHTITVRAEGYSDKTQQVVLLDQASNTVKVIMGSDKVYDVSVSVSNPYRSVQGATVTFENASGTYSKKTDASGIAVIYGVPEGSYTMTVSANDHVTETLPFTISKNSTEGVMLTMLRSPQLTFRSEEDNKAVSGAKVRLVDKDNPSVTYPANNGTQTTNGQGIVIFSNIPEGDYMVVFEHDDYSLKDEAVTFSLKEGNINEEFMTKERLIKATLTIRDKNNSVLGNASVTLTRKSNDTYDSENPSDENGIVVLDVPSGTYTVSVTIGGEQYAVLTSSITIDPKTAMHTIFVGDIKS